MITILNEGFGDQYDLAYADSKRGKFHIYAGDGEYNEYTNEPNEAVELWFKAQKKFPMDVAIFTTKEFGDEFYDAITEEFITAMEDKYGSPYRLDIMLNWFRYAKSRGFEPFDDEYEDQVIPFTYG